MAHFLTTNWTQKIKTNPVANMILNSKRPKSYRVAMRKLTKRPGEGKLMTNRFMAQFLGPEEDVEIVDEEEFKAKLETYATIPQRREVHNKIIMAKRQEDELKLAEEAKKDGAGDGSGIALGDAGDVAVVVGGAGDGGDDDDVDDEDDDDVLGAVKKYNDNDFDDAVSVDSEYGSEEYLVDGEEIIGGDMWENVYVDDYINIHHPKLRPHFIDLISQKPLQIKSPSVFFSDV